ncbi:hypothetical protein HRbin08_01856 [bacterium HR08]|nr:hypothetical protein HRbin08_01856 [bacterium HR08]
MNTSEKNSIPLEDLIGEDQRELALFLVLRDSVEYRLLRLRSQVRAFEEKYGMSFEEYQAQWASREREEDYQWERERDYLEWEALITRKRRLEEIARWLDELVRT